MFAVFRTEFESSWALKAIALCLSVVFGWRVYRGNTRYAPYCLIASVTILAATLFPQVARVNRAYCQGKDQFEWLAQLKEEDPEKQQECIEALCVILREGKLQDPGWDARISKVLGHFGSKAKNAVSTLKKLISHDDERVREAALDALQKIDPEEFSKLKK
jgi:hypothetical protein